MKGNERQKYIKSVTPKWVDQKAINKLYYKSWKLGANYNVDHIVPLFSSFVCGLHCEDNLQIITMIKNNRKSNIWWPNMWNEQQWLNLDCIREYQYELPL